MAKQDDYVRYTIRVPAGLYERLQAAAGEKSVNAEIVERLEAASVLRDALDDLTVGAELTQTELRLAERKIQKLEAERSDALRKLHEETERISLLGHRRIPEGLFGRIKMAAAANNRPIEEEVIQALEAAYPIPKLTFGEYMQNLRDWLAATEGKKEYTVRPMFEALLQAYEACAQSHPGWTAKRPKIEVSPGAFPMNFEPAEDDAA